MQRDIGTLVDEAAELTGIDIGTVATEIAGAVVGGVVGGKVAGKIGGVIGTVVGAAAGTLAAKGCPQSGIAIAVNVAKEGTA